MKRRYLIFIVLIMVLLAAPLILMPDFGSNWTTETTELAGIPTLRNEDGSLNMSFLSDAGAYFEDHFAFRPELITASSKLDAALFGTSSTDQVITGKKGWLYYSGTLKDHQRTNTLTDRQAFNIIHNLKMINNYYKAAGIDFVLTIAPDKCSLYPEYLPYYIVAGEGESNADILKQMLSEAGIAYADMFEAFENDERILYYRTDTHWNELGAALAFKTLTETMGKSDITDYDRIPYTLEKVHSGDLAEMLWPEAVKLEEDAVFDLEKTWEYTETVEDNMDDFFITENPSAGGSIYIFRDSFGSALVPYFAQDFGKVVFSRLAPYNITDPFRYETETVIIEKAERNILSLAKDVPAMPSISANIAADSQIETRTTCTISESGGYYVISGAIDPDVFTDDTGIYVETEFSDGQTKTYEAFYLTGENAKGATWDYLYRVNIVKKDGMQPARVRVIISHEGEYVCVCGKSEM